MKLLALTTHNHTLSTHAYQPIQQSVHATKTGLGKRLRKKKSFQAMLELRQGWAITKTGRQ